MTWQRKLLFLLKNTRDILNKQLQHHIPHCKKISEIMQDTYLWIHLVGYKRLRVRIGWGFVMLITTNSVKRRRSREDVFDNTLWARLESLSHYAWFSFSHIRNVSTFWLWFSYSPSPERRKSCWDATKPCCSLLNSQVWIF